MDTGSEFKPHSGLAAVSTDPPVPLSAPPPLALKNKLFKNGILVAGSSMSTQERADRIVSLQFKGSDKIQMAFSSLPRSLEKLL